MANLEKKLTEKKALDFGDYRPEILDFGKTEHRRKAEKLLLTHPQLRVIDEYQKQLEELFEINNPHLIFRPDFKKLSQNFINFQQKNRPLWQQGKWIYYPWLNCLTHILEEKDFFAVRTARNKNLITQTEQKKFYSAVVGIGGLSIGNSVALALALQGGAKHIRLADHDKLALSNTNRIRAGMQNLGLFKTTITARQIYELNPYGKVEIFSEGLSKENLEKFFKGPPKLDIIVDELDNLAVKYLIREKAKKYRVPVVMGADNGDGVVVDIERYDINPNTDFFRGALGRTSYKQLVGLSKLSAGKIIAKLIGQKNVARGMQKSLSQIGKTIVSWPQLGSAAALNGSAIAYCCGRIANGHRPVKKQTAVSFEKILK